MAGEVGDRWVYSVEELKAQLPILYAAAEVGIQVDEQGRAVCIFHDDHSPSMHFKVGEPGGDWWVCSPCGTGGDVINLVQRAEELDFPTALVRCSQMLEEMPETWQRPDAPRQPRWVPDAAWEERLAECQRRTADNADYGLTAYAYGFVEGTEDPAVLRLWDDLLVEWGWGLDAEGRVVIPHRGPEGELKAVKLRPRRRGWRAYGSLEHLYGSWRAPRHDQVILCEGESDCVWAWGQRAGVDCLALPSGARGARNDWAQRLKRWPRRYLALDADKPGEEATSSWAWAMQGPQTRVVVLRPGADLRSDGRPLADLLRQARPSTAFRRGSR